MHDDNEPGARPSRKRGNRVLLTVGLGAALAAVGCLVALSGASAAPSGVSAAPVAQSRQLAQTRPATPAGQARTGTASRPGTGNTYSTGNAGTTYNASAQTRSGTTRAAAPKAAAAHTVQIENYAFAPKSLTINVGDTVTWTNEDTAPHTVTTSSGPAKISSANLSKGQSFSYTFTKAGTYAYYCAVHPDMTATITVVAAPGGSGGGTSGGGTGGTTGGSTGGTSGGMTGGGTGGMSGGMTGGSTGGGTGSTGGTGGDECYSVQQVLVPILNHINSAHLGESVGQQVQDALSLDDYLKLHTVWVESVITPAVGGSTSILDQTLTTLFQHLNSAHLEEPLDQQVQDILNPEQYVSSHLVLAEHLLAPTESYLTSSC